MTLEDYIAPLRATLARPELLRSAVGRFLDVYWPAERPAEIGERAWEILGDLALDLEYYEPNPEWRREDKSFYGDERAVAEIRAALERLSNECGIKTEPCA